MDDTEFDRFFAVLDSNSSRSRIVFYFFLIINLSMLSFSLNAFGWSFSKERLSKFYQITSMCIGDNPSHNPEDQAQCNNFASKLLIKMSKKDPQNTLDEERLKHYEDSYIDEIAQGRKFIFPFFGVTSDIVYLL